MKLNWLHARLKREAMWSLLQSSVDPVTHEDILGTAKEQMKESGEACVEEWRLDPL